MRDKSPRAYPLYLTAAVQGRPAHLLVDSGSSISIISESFLSSIGDLHVRVEKEDIQATSVVSELLDITGSVRLTASLGGMS